MARLVRDDVDREARVLAGLALRRNGEVLAVDDDLHARRVAEHDRERWLAAHLRLLSRSAEAVVDALAACVGDLGPALLLERDLERDDERRSNAVVGTVRGNARARRRRGHRERRRADR